MFKKILIANRGEIACRIIRSARAMGIICVAIYSEVDRHARHVRHADEAYCVGEAAAQDSYLQAERIISIAQQAGAEAIHPGYGFLSENPEFADLCAIAGLVFIGPPAQAIRAMGLKDAAKQLMRQAGVAVVPGYEGDVQTTDHLVQQADGIGYPVLIKARAGGGGKGMRRVDCAADFPASLAAVQRESLAAFNDDQVLIEKYIASPRHIEIQIFADTHDNTVHLFERDCSLQRRHQKVMEEAPAPGLSEAMRNSMGQAAIKAAQAVGYVGAGTVEFIVDASEGLQPDRFWFMEMNTRLQVEHPVTEAITGHDLVQWQLLVASGEVLPVTQAQLTITGHAFEARIYAENANKGFVPAVGYLSQVHLAEDLARVDSAVDSGDEVSPYYDSMVAKLIVHAKTRHAALAQLQRALQASRIEGCATNLTFLSQLTQQNDVQVGQVDTGLIERELAQLTEVREPDILSIALAALGKSALLQSTSKSLGVAESLPGWSHWGDGAEYVDLQWQGQVLELQLRYLDAERLQVNAGEETLTLRLLTQEQQQDGVQVRIEIAQALQDSQAFQVQALLLPSSVGITVFHTGQRWHFSLPDYLQQTAQTAQSVQTADQVIAPMPGQIKLLMATVGQSVQAGESVLVMEAMKMEMSLVAPRDGMIAAVHVQQGDQVDDGTLLLQLASQSEAS